MSQDDHPRVQRIKEYVLSRLREELASAPRGAQAQLAKSLGVSGAHLSNMLSYKATRQPGEDFRRKVAAHWGVTYGQLEALALGEEAPVSGRSPAPWRDENAPANLSAVLAEYAWMTELPSELRAVVRQQAMQHLGFGGFQYTRDEWQRILTGLEREALAILARRPRQPSEMMARTPKKRSVRTSKARSRA